MPFFEDMPPALIGAGVTLLLAAIGFTVWLVRLEGKITSVTKDLADLERKHDDDIKCLKDEVKDTRERFFKHAADVLVHHNAEATLEFRTALERRFTGMEDTLKDIGRKLNHIAGRE
jgi:hypothetical protein